MSKGEFENSMTVTTLHIKNMVCDRCRMAVEQTLRDVGLEPLSVELGVAVVRGGVGEEQLARLAEALGRIGFELLGDRRSQTVERIRTAVIELVHYGADRRGSNLSAFLSDRLCSDYSALSKLFSEQTGMTIERFYILQRIERAKELIFYGEKTLAQIANELGYPSAAYLSSQFKAITGLTPTQFKASRDQKLRPLDSI